MQTNGVTSHIDNFIVSFSAWEHEGDAEIEDAARAALTVAQNMQTCPIAFPRIVWLGITFGTVEFRKA